jgi:hypothetical protein
MKKPYQIEAGSRETARRNGRRWKPGLQMVLLLAEMVGWLRQGVGALIRQAGVRLMELLMEEEAESCLGNAADSSRIDHEPVGQGARLLRGDGLFCHAAA